MGVSSRLDERSRLLESSSFRSISKINTTVDDEFSGRLVHRVQSDNRQRDSLSSDDFKEWVSDSADGNRIPFVSSFIYPHLTPKSVSFHTRRANRDEY